MAEKSNGSSGTAPASADKGAADKAPGPFQVQVVAQYIKDLSFENPSVDKLLTSPPEETNVSLEVNVAARRMQAANLYEAAIELRAQPTSKVGTVYILEVTYAGLFRIQNIPEEALEPFLLVNCPTLIFPFLRRLAADVTREGGFSPLMLDPIDFGALFMSRNKVAAESTAKIKS